LVTQFREVLREVRKALAPPGGVRWHPAVLRFLNGWLDALDANDEDKFNKIADDGEKVGRSRERTFRDLISAAYLAVGAYDPKHGFAASPLALEETREESEGQKKLAECAEALAKHYRDGGHSFDRAEFHGNDPRRYPSYRTELNAWLEERAKFYEGEAAKFRERSENAAKSLPRQKRSGKREDAWARRRFVETLASSIDSKFGERYSAAVAAMTDIAFPPADGRDTTAKEVDDICGPRESRTRSLGPRS
jgi:hypothetical protein